MTEQKLYKSIARKIIPALRKLFNKTFSSQSDAYGNKWKRLESGKKFDSDGMLRKSVTFSQEGGSVVAKSHLDFYIYHQTGTENLPARPSFPISGKGDPWKKEVKALIDKEIREFTKDNLKLAWKGVKTSLTSSKGRRKK